MKKLVVTKGDERSKDRMGHRSIKESWEWAPEIIIGQPIK